MYPYIPTLLDLPSTTLIPPSRSSQTTEINPLCYSSFPLAICLQSSPKIGRRPKQTFLQRRHTDGQEANEGIHNIVNYQRNANENPCEVSPHTSQNGHHQKNLQRINAREGVEKKEPSCTAGGKVKKKPIMRFTRGKIEVGNLEI